MNILPSVAQRTKLTELSSTLSHHNKVSTCSAITAGRLREQLTINKVPRRMLRNGTLEPKPERLRYRQRTNKAQQPRVMGKATRILQILKVSS